MGNTTLRERKGHRSFRAFLLYPACIILFYPGTSNLVRADELPTLAGPTQGTTYRIRFGQQLTEVALAELHVAIEALLAEIDRHMSTYRGDSDLSHFNRTSSVEWFAMPSDVVTVIKAALEINRQSAGAFDVTVAPLVDLWGFGPRGQPGRVPSAEEIAHARRAVGSELVEVRTEPPALRKRRPEVRLDVNAIAPGYTVDRLGQCLERHHVTNYLVELGGEIRTRGHTADGRPWRVGIARPSKQPSGVHRVLALGNGAISTSGDYRNYFEHGGKRYAHHIDPRTGCPVDHAATSVSVVTDECMLADGWATALIVLGPEAGLRLAEERALAAYFLIREARESGGGLRVGMTSRFAQRFGGGADDTVTQLAVSGGDQRRDDPVPRIVGAAVACLLVGLLATVPWLRRQKGAKRSRT